LFLIFLFYFLIDTVVFSSYDGGWLLPPKKQMSIQEDSWFVKGASSLDWGMKNRLARIFSRDTGKTVMLAIDHGYFEGPAAGLEQVDRSIVPFLDHADALMATRGVVRTSIPPSFTHGVVLRASGGASVLKELSNEKIAVDVEDALRLNAAGLAVTVFIGGEYETQTVHNLTTLVDLGNRHGIPVLAVTVITDEAKGDAKYYRMACRICAELGAHFVKTYYVDKDFDSVVASCPAPVVVAGGNKLPEFEALTMTHRAMQAGAAGMDMGRNIFQAEAPAAMIQAVRAVVHGGETPKKAFELYASLKNDRKGPRAGVPSKAPSRASVK
jgi:3-hydroxy-5-phosphonooxypentane-2,4-dione thiolase